LIIHVIYLIFGSLTHLLIFGFFSRPPGHRTSTILG